MADDVARQRCETASAARAVVAAAGGRGHLAEICRCSAPPDCRRSTISIRRRPAPDHGRRSKSAVIEQAKKPRAGLLLMVAAPVQQLVEGSGGPKAHNDARLQGIRAMGCGLTGCRTLAVYGGGLSSA